MMNIKTVRPFHYIRHTHIAYMRIFYRNIIHNLQDYFCVAHKHTQLNFDKLMISRNFIALYCVKILMKAYF